MSDELLTDAIVEDENLYKAFRLMKSKKYGEAEELITDGIREFQEKKDPHLEGLYHTVMGMLQRLKKDYTKAYKSYQQAERLLKDDASVKIVSAWLLIEQFKQYSTAERKMRKVLAVTKDPALSHHALAVCAVSLLLMGKKEDAAQCFQQLISEDFSRLRFAANLDYKTIEVFVKKKFMLAECREYLSKALALAKRQKEKTYILVTERLLRLV